MRQFLRRLLSYWKALIAALLFGLTPYVWSRAIDAVFDSGIEWVWKLIDGPSWVIALLQWLAIHPIRGAAIGGVIWVVLAAALSERHIRRTSKSSPGDTQTTAEATAWRAQAARFDAIDGEVEALWRHYPQSGLVKWELYQAVAGGTARTVQSFESEAHASALVLDAMRERPGKFALDLNADPVDRWMNAVAALIVPDDDSELSGTDPDGEHIGGAVANVVKASAIACSMLATGRWLADTSTPRVRSKPMTLNESFDNFIPARDDGLAAIELISISMRTWGQRTSAIKDAATEGARDKGARDAYWCEQAEAMEEYAKSLAIGCAALARSVQRLRRVIDARMHWHDRRNVAADLLGSESKEVFGGLRAVCGSNQLKLRDNIKRLQDHAMGWDPRMDAAAQKWQREAERLIAAYSAMEALASEILAFRYQRTGLRAWTRSLTSRLHSTSPKSGSA